MILAVLIPLKINRCDFVLESTGIVAESTGIEGGIEGGWHMYWYHVCVCVCVWGGGNL